MPRSPPAVEVAVDNRMPGFISPSEPIESSIQTQIPGTSGTATGHVQPHWHLGTDSLNVLMNAVLEQMEKGPVSMNMVARIKAHPMYDQRPMVKELLESIIAAQPPSVQKEASKIIHQQQQTQV